MKKALILASVSSMIDQFNRLNIHVLQELGYEIHIIANFQTGGTISDVRSKETKKELVEMNVIVHDLMINRSFLSFANVKAYKETKNIIERENFNLIHCHSPIGGVITRLAARKIRNKGTKVIYTAHGFHFYKGSPWKNVVLYYPIEKLLSRFTDCLITINSEDFKLASDKKFHAKKIEWVNGVGIDLNKFKPIYEYAKDKLRESYGYKKDDFIVICVAELNKNKHQDLLIAMMSRLIKKVPAAKLLLVGRGPLKKQYKKQIERLDLEDHISLLGYREDIAQLLQMADAAVSASKREGLPVNVMEAMATRLPLVVTDCRGSRDLVNDGENGYIVGVNDAEGFSVRLEELYRSKDKVESFGKSSLASIEKYSEKTVKKQIQKIYLEITSTKDGARCVNLYEY